jgi:hypothetical protein
VDQTVYYRDEGEGMKHGEVECKYVHGFSSFLLGLSEGEFEDRSERRQGAGLTKEDHGLRWFAV